jgi:hypothetical protein
MAVEGEDDQTLLVVSDNEVSRGQKEYIVLDLATFQLVEHHKVVQFLICAMKFYEHFKFNSSCVLYHSPGENKMTAFMQPTSLESGES